MENEEEKCFIIIRCPQRVLNDLKRLLPLLFPPLSSVSSTGEM
jgi:hypothetical protein